MPGPTRATYRPWTRVWVVLPLLVVLFVTPGLGVAGDVDDVERTSVEDGLASAAMLLAYDAGRSVCLRDVFSPVRGYGQIDYVEAIDEALLEEAKRGKKISRTFSDVIPPKYQGSPYRHVLADVLLPLLVNGEPKARAHDTGVSSRDLIALMGPLLLQGYSDCAESIRGGLSPVSSDEFVASLLEHMANLYAYQCAVVADRLPTAQWAEGTPVHAQMTRILVHPKLNWLTLDAKALRSGEEEPEVQGLTRVGWMRLLRAGRRPVPSRVKVYFTMEGVPTLSPLIRMLYQKDAEVSGMACEMLWAVLMGNKGAPSSRVAPLAMPRLFALASSRDATVSTAACAALSKLSRYTLDHLRRALESQDDQEVEIAIRVVGRTSPEDARAAGEGFRDVLRLLENHARGSDLARAHRVLLALDHVTGEPHRLVADLEGRTYLGKTPEFWVGHLGSPSDDVRAIAGTALSRIGSPATPAVLRALSDHDSRARAGAASAVNKFPRPPDEVITTLIGLLRDRDGDVRGQAALALGRYGPLAHEAVPGLTSLLGDTVPWNVGVAATTLGNIGVRAAPALPALTKMKSGELSFIEKMGVDSAIREIGEAVAAHVALLKSDPALSIGEDPAATGLLLTEITPESSAEVAGLVIGDILVAYAREETTDTASLVRAKRRAENTPHEVVPISWVTADGARRTGTIQTGMLGVRFVEVREGVGGQTLPAATEDALELLQTPPPDLDAWFAVSVVSGGRSRPHATLHVRDRNDNGVYRSIAELVRRRPSEKLGKESRDEYKVQLGEEGVLESYVENIAGSGRTVTVRATGTSAAGRTYEVAIEGDAIQSRSLTWSVPAGTALVAPHYVHDLACRLTRKAGACVHFRMIADAGRLSPPLALWCRGVTVARAGGRLRHLWLVEVCVPSGVVPGWKYWIGDDGTWWRREVKEFRITRTDERSAREMVEGR